MPYVIEVWSTWCEPCVKAMQDLHTLHARVAADDPPRLRIISAAINDTRLPVEEFRRERWPMPWTNVWVPGGDPLFKGWSFEGVPSAVLVGADGRVLPCLARRGARAARRSSLKLRDAGSAPSSSAGRGAPAPLPRALRGG